VMRLGIRINHSDCLKIAQELQNSLRGTNTFHLQIIFFVNRTKKCKYKYIYIYIYKVCV
jgi:hypothetical protein